MRNWDQMTIAKTHSTLSDVSYPPTIVRSFEWLDMAWICVVMRGCIAHFGYFWIELIFDHMNMAVCEVIRENGWMGPKWCKSHEWIKNCSDAKTRWIKIQDLKVNRRKNRLLFNYREIPDSVACNFILSGKDISSNCLISMITVSYSQLDGWVPVR